MDDDRHEQPGKTPRQKAGIRRTVIILALVALGFYVGFVLKQVL
jgi:hypothetical protein